MSGLPEWKVQLLERKKKDEEEQRQRDEEQRERLSKMPTWKREIIERRRAKMGSSGTSFSEAAGSWDGPHSVALYSPTTNTFYSNNAEPTESLVLQEKIGPVHENLFIKLEKQQKEIFESDTASRVRQMIDLYAQTPGVRTIKAENIVIIESDPCIFQQNSAPLKEDAKCKSMEALNEPVSIHECSSKPDIHPADMLVSKSTLSRSVEDLKSFKWQEDLRAKGRPHRGTVSKLLSKFGQEKSGWIRPARSLSTENIVDKADSQDSFKDPVQASSSPHSGDLFLSQEDGNATGHKPSTVARPFNLSNTQSLDLSRATPTFEGEKAQEDAVIAFYSQSKAKEPLPRLESPCKSPTCPNPLLLKEHSRHSEATDENHLEQEPTQRKPTDTKGIFVPSLHQTTSDSTSPRDSFQIQPAPLPEFSLMADDDLQGKALTNLRLQTKSSSVVIPHRQPAPPLGPQLSPSHREETSCLCKSSASCCLPPSSSCLSAGPAAAISCTEDRQQPVENALGVSCEGAWPLNCRAQSAKDLVERQEEIASQDSQSLQDSANMSRLYNLKPAPMPGKISPLAAEEGRLSPFSVRTASALFGQTESPVVSLLSPDQGIQPAKDLSMSRMGNVVSVGRGPSRLESPAAPSSPELVGKATHPAMQRRSGNTITVNPRKGPPTHTRASPTRAENGCLETDTTASADTFKAALVKKRYPTAEEIQVLGGYLSLERSCLAKNNPNRKKFKISFSESRLESTYEYPSESSLLEEYGPPEELETPAQLQTEEEEEEEETLRIMRTKSLIVDESCRR